MAGIAVLVLLGGCASVRTPETPAPGDTQPATADTAPPAPTLIPLDEPLPPARADRAPPESLRELPLDTVRPVDELYQFLPEDLRRGEHELLQSAPRSVTGYGLTLAAVFYLRQDYDQAAQILSLLSPERMSPGQTARYTALSARTELALGRPDNALAWLESPVFGATVERLRYPEQVALAQVRVNALTLTGRYLEAARYRVQLDANLLTDEAARRANREATWLALLQLPATEINNALRHARDPALTGWLELVQVYRSRAGAPLPEALSRWAARHPGHDAAGNWPYAISRALAADARRPDRVALMLPRTGPLARRGEAVQDGFMAAWYTAKNQGLPVPELVFIDETAGDPRALAASVAEHDVDWLVGPLSQNATFRLEAARDLPVPILALNQTDRSVIENERIIQFGLAPTGQARQVATQAWRSGFRNAAIVAGHTRDHEDAARAFRDQWQRLGGQVVAQQSVPADDDGRRYLAEVKALLAIDASEERTWQMRRLLGSNLITEPRRRQDIDFLFMPANAAQARSLRPLLNFQFAADLPVLSTTALIDPATTDRNEDLQGIRALETPWRLGRSPMRAELMASLPDYSASEDRYYGLGVDAFRALEQLAVWQEQPQLPLNGVTGTMTLSPTGQVQRQLLWAQFNNGELVAIEPTP